MRTRNVVGRTIAIDSRTFRVAGVAPPGFLGTMSAFAGDVWLPSAAYTRLAGLDEAYVVPIGRLRPGIGRELAEERVASAALTIPPVSAAVTVRGARLDGLLWRGDLEDVLALATTILLAAAALLLLTACANIAGMLLARSHDRRREIAIRLAVGAGRPRLVRQALVDSVALALLGGVAGVVVAWLGTAALSAAEVPIDATIAPPRPTSPRR